MLTTLTNQYQITIPSWARKRAGLKPGDKFVVLAAEKNLILEKLQPVEELAGSLATYKKNQKPYTSADLWSQDYRRKYVKSQGTR